MHATTGPAGPVSATASVQVAVPVAGQVVLTASDERLG